MPVELIKNPLKAFTIVGENVYSTVLEEDMNVPDINPDLYKILDTKAEVVIDACESMKDMVMVNGEIKINILYSGDMEGRPLCAMNTTKDISCGVELAGCQPKMRNIVSAKVQNISCTMINSRKINIKIIIDINCKVMDSFEMGMPSDIRGLKDVQLLREPVCMKQMVACIEDECNISEEIELGEDKSPISQILRCNCRLKSKEAELLSGKIELTGILEVSFAYCADDDTSTIMCHEADIPFTQYIEIPRAELGMECAVSMKLCCCDIEPRESEDGCVRSVCVEALICVVAKVFEKVEQDIISDAYCKKSKLELQRENFKLYELLCIEKGSTVIKESLTVKAGEPEIEKVCCINAVPDINDIRIVDDKVLIEGMIDISVVYMSSFSADPMCTLKGQIPFRQTVDAPGARVGMMSMVNSDLLSVSYNLLNNQMMDLRMVLFTEVEIYRPMDKKLIVGITEKELIAQDVSKLPAITVYVSQKGDSLWTIAKRYNTTVDDLSILNNIDNPKVLEVGTKLIITKGIRIN